MATERNQNEGQVKGNLVGGWRVGHNQYSTELVHQSTTNQMGGFKTELLTGSAVIPVSQPPQLLASGCQAQCQGVKQWAEFMLLKSNKIWFYYRGWFIIILFFMKQQIFYVNSLAFIIIRSGAWRNIRGRQGKQGFTGWKSGYSQVDHANCPM